MRLMLLGFAPAVVAAACTTNLDCSLNGICKAGACSCDVPWDGVRCETMVLAPGKVGIGGLPLAAYHGDDPTHLNSTSWGASVLHAPEDGKYYAFAASMINNCLLGDWQTNSEVVLAVSGERGMQHISF